MTIHHETLGFDVFLHVSIYLTHAFVRMHALYKYLHASSVGIYHVYTNIYMYICTYIHIYICIYIRIHIYTYIRTNVNMYLCI